MDDLDGELLETLRSVQWRLRRRSHGDVEDLDITPAQGRVLRIVGRCDRPPRMGEVAARLHIAPRSLTDLVDPLEEAGLLHRATDPENRRSLLLELTPAGTGVLEELGRRSRDSAARAFAVLDPPDRRSLLELLRRVEQALGEDAEPRG